ncbi:ATP-binding protein [Sphingomonas crusticola]|uniref:ATP-binding protein n=1 Tax=Sphingomonas crusticola TaxID=1697973 RepID=UPI001F07DC02|nr:ATP-binding protein [Sphingomonas crusticola]
MMGSLLRRMMHRLAETPAIGIGLAFVLLLASLLLAYHNEDQARAEKVREVQVQARVLAGSLAGPLAFDDDDAAREYIDALKASPEFNAVGAYGADGRLVAGFARRGEPLPQVNHVAPPVIRGAELIVTSEVDQGGAKLGSVYVDAATESWSRRAARYLGIAIVIVMACLLVAVLAGFYASVSAANRRLQAEITGRREAEEALRQSQKMEAMGQLTGGVAHDFNNLLMVASSGMELLERTTDPVRRDRLKDGIRQAIDRGAKLTQQLLTFARRSPLTPEVLDIGARVRGLEDLLERSLREDITVEFDFANGLWPVEVDPSQLDVAVLNIAINARDAMASGGIIRISARNVPTAGEGSDDMVHLSIRDNGTGIAPEMLEKVFEPFFTTKSVGSGTGLGLSQVYGFVRSSGGEVRIESELGKGTSVSLLFPRSAQRLPHAATRKDGIGETGHNAAVLVAEDDDHVADLVCEMLRELGYRAERVAAAPEALRALEEGGPFDLVLSDMIMPGKMNGLELAQEVVRREPDLPVVLMTGFSEAAAAAAAEGFPLLIKPYTIEALGEALSQALTSR